MKKLLRDHFPGETPIRVEPGKREQLGREILQHLERFGESVDTQARHYYYSESSKERPVCSFALVDPDRNSYHNDYFELFVGDAGELVLKHGHDQAATTPVASLDELDSFIRDCRQRFQRRQALTAKRQKVRDLKAHAIVAQVKKLAKELEFDFKTETDRQKLKLFVKLSGQHAVRVDVPFNKFEETLPHLRTMISSVRDLYDTGIRFNLVNRAKWGWRSNWISYKDG